MTKIAIHNSPQGFHPIWVSYCKEKGIPFRLVNCYDSDIIDQLRDCDGLMWQHHHGNPKDILFAKQLLFSLEQQGKAVFPDFKSAWHFDDKLGQKYLLEALNIDLVPTWVFYSEKSALDWVDQTDFPKVFKLRRGAGSRNVRLIKTRDQARRIVKKAFRSGFSTYSSSGSLKERYRKYRLGKTDLWDVSKGVLRIFNPPQYARVTGKETGYVYFQEFIPDNEYDIRVIVIDGKAFFIKRIVRKNDFRASGSGAIEYARNLVDEEWIELAFDYSKRLDAQSVGFDFVFDQGKPLVVEISYGFTSEAYYDCAGYWNEDMEFKPGKFNPQSWMVDSLLRSIEMKSKYVQY